MSVLFTLLPSLQRNRVPSPDRVLSKQDRTGKILPSPANEGEDKRSYWPCAASSRGSRYGAGPKEAEAASGRRKRRRRQRRASAGRERRPRAARERGVRRSAGAATTALGRDLGGWPWSATARAGAPRRR